MLYDQQSIPELNKFFHRNDDINLQYVDLDESIYYGSSTISNKLINLVEINNYYGGLENIEESIERNKCTKKALVKFLKFWRFKHKLKKLWKIAEYYMAKKYHPDNILKYAKLEE